MKKHLPVFLAKLSVFYSSYKLNIYANTCTTQYQQIFFLDIFFRSQSLIRSHIIKHFLCSLSRNFLASDHYEQFFLALKQLRLQEATDKYQVIHSQFMVYHILSLNQVLIGNRVKLIPSTLQSRTIRDLSELHMHSQGC